VQNCSPWEGLTLEKFVGPHAGAGAECEEEGAANTTCNELIATLIPCPSPLHRRR